jgi:hypothetical protein
MQELCGGPTGTAMDVCALDGVPSLDLVWRAAGIARFLGCTPKAVYRLAESRRAPIFRINGTLCARRSALVAFIAAEEQKRCA